MFKFKGNRNYLHGTDFYQCTVDYAESNLPANAYLCQLTFKRFANKQCELVETQPSLKSIVATGKFMLCNGKTQPFWWSEQAKLVTKRYDFDEETLVSHAQLDLNTKTIQLSQFQQQNICIEVVVALTKKLHNELSLPIKGKWVFGQLNLIQPLPINYESIFIELKLLLDSKFSRSAIYINSVYVGEIRFIVGEP